MYKQLKIRFILLTVISMTLTLGLAFTAVNITLRLRLAKRTDEIIDVIKENDGFPMFDTSEFRYQNESREFQDETPYRTRYYIAHLDSSGEIVKADYGHIAIMNIERIIEQVNDIKSCSKNRGYIDTFRYGKFTNDDGFTIIGVDCKSDINTLNTLLTITLVTAVSCIIIVFIILLLLSGKIIKPAEVLREKQRRFITDAGHELKTPIAVIRSNTEVLEMTEGENKWLDNIKQQTVRMSVLVRGLIELSKMDEQILAEKEKQKIILSEIVHNSIESFRVPAENKGIIIKENISEKVSVLGDLEDIIRLVGILLDNAIKYTDDRKEVSVKLCTKSKKAVLVVSNTCKGLKKEDIDKFFDRFYRSDSSRNSDSGGYGIGLSMAQAIVQNHKGKISAQYSNDEIISFNVEI